MEDIGIVIKQLRKNKKMTQRMLAEDICSQSVLSRIENSEEIPNVWVMHQLCNRLGVTMEEIFAQDSEELRKKKKWLSRIGYHLRHGEQKELEKALNDKLMMRALFLDSDLQQYYYYLGSYYYYYEQDLDKAYDTLQYSLKLTYNNAKKNYSPLEILVISCMGRVLAEKGNMKEGLILLDQSVAWFDSIPDERLYFTLIKIFYNRAYICMKMKRYEEAAKSVDQGMEWALTQHSHYFLKELFQIKAELLENQGRTGEVAYYKELAQSLEKIDDIEGAKKFK